ncbi:MAG: hypothetical protein JNM25_00385 [Planctomycetes bacterium]|nr:hypothetical protein [Planctomycetota bacterium]
MTRARRWLAVLGLLWLVACQSTAGEVGGLADLPPLDRAVLVTGGAFLVSNGEAGTFAPAARPGDPALLLAEPIAIDVLVDELRQSRVFQRVALDGDAGHRRLVRDRLRAGAGDPEVQQFLQRAREQGFDLLLVVEELQDGPIDAQGTNGRWPVTFLTWILLGFGALIPDHTFESRATLRVTLRELQTGRVLHDPLLVGGPIELALFERSDLVGLLLSMVVPPFWVGDDAGAVGEAVRDTTRRRLLLSLARDLKSESVRQRLRERSAARLSLVEGDAGLRVTADSAESLSVVRLRSERALSPEVAAGFERALLASRRLEGDRFYYEAPLPNVLRGDRVQVLVGTIRGTVSSATFAPGAGR